MKKYIIYTVILIVGLLLGLLFFGKSPNNEAMYNHSEMVSKNQMWTCSMHPQIIKVEPGKCPICGMDLIPAQANVEGLNVNEFKLSKNAMALANIQTSIIYNRTSKDVTVKLSGKIAENEEANVVQASYFSGRVERLNISSVGEEVRKGQLLATIYSPQLFLAQQELITASSFKESQPALYNAVRNKLKLWKISNNQIDQIEASGKVNRNFPIYATVSGTVSEKLVEQGDYIKEGQALFKIINLNTVWALFDVYENQVEIFKKGQNISVTTTAYPNKGIKAKVDFIDPAFNSATRTIKLRVVLNNKNREFKIGMFVEGNLKSDKKQYLTIPSSAILWTGERSVVYLKTNPNKPIFEIKEITIGKQLGEQYEVVDGLKSGDEIVTNGTFTVDASAQLQGKKSMMNKDYGNTMTRHKGHTLDKIKKMHFNSNVEKSFQPIIKAYIDLKDALIQSDVALASAKGKTFRKALEKISVSQRAQTYNYWSILHQTSKGFNANVSLKHQRKRFQIISDKLIEMVMNFDEVDSKLFIQFCPMANNNNGASWLSKEKKVLNPYFGDKMLKCGSVKKVIE